MMTSSCTLGSSDRYAISSSAHTFHCHLGIWSVPQGKRQRLQVKKEVVLARLAVYTAGFHVGSTAGMVETEVVQEGFPEEGNWEAT